MSLKQCFLGMLALGMSTSMIAQSTCDLAMYGRVIDEHDQTALSYAEVYVLGTSLGAISDENGSYRIEGICPGRHVLVCMHLGCEPIYDTLLVETDLAHDFFPEHHAEWLREVAVQGLKRDSSGVHSRTTVSLKGEESGQSLGKALSSIVGVNTLSTGGSIAKPVIHGLHSNRLLVMNNGVRQEGQQWGNEHAPEVDPSIADELVVIKGASGVRYGPDAIAGVVLVNPSPIPAAFGLGGAISLNAQSNGLGGGMTGMLQGRHKRLKALGWRAQGSVKKLGDQTTPTIGLKNTGMEEWNFSLTGSLADARKGVELFYSQFNTNLGILSASHIGNLSDLERAFDSDEPLETAPFSYRIRRPYQHVVHELTKLSGFWKTGAKGEFKWVYGRQYNLREEYDRHRGADSTLPGLQFEIITHSIDLTYDRAFNNGHSVQVGTFGLLQKNTFEGRFFIPNFRKWNGGIFAVHRWILARDWEIETGFRIDYLRHRIYLQQEELVRQVDHRYLQPSVTSGATKRFNQHWQWKGQIATAWRPPTANELYSNGLHHGAASFEIGDTNLRSEVSYAAMSSVLFKNERWEIEAEVHMNWMNDFIYLAPRFPATLTIRGAFPTFGYEQTDALLYGLNARVAYRFASDWMVISRTALIRARNLAERSWLVQIPADQSALSLKYEHSYSKWELLVEPAIQWVNKQWRVPPSSDYMPPPDGYLIGSITMGLTKIHANSETQCFVVIHNLFNQRYRDYLNRYRYYADEVGRNISLRLAHRF